MNTEKILSKSRFGVWGTLILLIILGAYYWIGTQQNTKIAIETTTQDKFATAPAGYKWYITQEGGFAFLYPDTSRIDICADPGLCKILGTATGGIIVNNYYGSKFIPGGKDGGALWRRSGKIEMPDFYPHAITITYQDTESRQPQEEAINTIHQYYPNAIVFTENDRGMYTADFMKPLPPVFLVTKVGVFHISMPANDPMQNTDIKVCTQENEADCTPLRPGRSYTDGDYEKMPEYINTIVQSFTVLQ
jgi:hypothetical protein